MEKKYCKCLVIMHNQLNNKTNNGKTVLSILSKIPRKDIGLLYLTKTENNEDKIKRSFYLSEKEQLLKFFNYYKLKNKIKEKKIKNSEKEQKNKLTFLRIFLDKISRSGIVLVIRNFLWADNRWWKPELDEWIKEFSPTMIFIVPGYIEGVMDCALYYSDKLNIPIVSFVTDDYFTKIKSKNILKNYIYKRLYKKYKKLSEKSKLHYVIGEKMAMKYNKFFYCNNIPIMNNVKLKEKTRSFEIQASPKFIFTGNIGIGRLKQLLRLGREIEKMNLKYSISSYLDIYTPEKISNKELKEIEKCKFCNYKGSIYGKELEKVVRSSDILVHAESFEKKYKNLLETALSTKIPEYMNSGKQILILGPKYSESVDYIFRNNAGYCITTEKEDITRDLYKMISNKKERIKNIENAFMCVEKNHSVEKRAKEIKTAFFDLI